MRIIFKHPLLISSVLTLSLLGLNACGKDDKDEAQATGPIVTLKGGGAEATNLDNAGTIDAALMKFKVYKFAASLTADCKNPITVFSSTAGIEQNMLTGSTFDRGRLAAGTYPCVMIEMSKVIKTAAAATDGDCIKDAEFSDVICNDESSQKAVLIDGTEVTCSGGASNDQRVTLYITTLSSGEEGSRAFLPPRNGSDALSGLKLENAYAVNADRDVTFKVTYKNFLSSGGGVCGTHAPSFTFE